jgi:hypothetical protein
VLARAPLTPHAAPPALVQVTHTWYEAKRGPKGLKQGLLQRAAVGRDVIMGAMGDSLPGLLLGAAGAASLVLVCWVADIALRVGGRSKRAAGAAARRHAPGKLRGDAAL